MPIYKVNGKTYDIPAEKAEKFEAKYPDATVDVYDGATGKGYSIPVGKRDAFKKKYPKWSYRLSESGDNTPEDTPADAEAPAAPSAPPAQKAEEKKEPWKLSPIQQAYALDQARTSTEATQRRLQNTVENTRRATRSLTQEGRDEKKAGEMTARMAGKYKKPLGLSPSVGGGEGSTETGPKSQQSPVVNGVKMVDGELKTEYMLPDGSLTTDFTEADRAEYNARSARLQHEFEKRMAKNGLDPSKQEDIEKQRQKDLLDESEKRVAIRLAENEANLRDIANRRAEEFDESTGWNNEEGFWENMTRIIGSNVRRGTEAQHPTNRPSESLTEDERDAQILMSENSVLNEAKNLLETRQLKKSNGFMGGFWNIGNNWRNMKMGARHTLGDVDLYSGGVMSLQKATQLLDMENRLKAGEDLSDAEVSLLYSTMLGQDVAHNTDTPHGYNAAQITVEMFPFMAQMMLNPASGLSQALVKKFGKSGLRKVAMTVAGDVAESAVLANTLQAPATIADAIELYQGEASEEYDKDGNRVVNFDGIHNWGTAIGKAEGAAVIENYTEMLGEHFGAIKDFAGKWIGKGVGKLGGGKIVDAVTDLTTKVKTSDWGKAIGNLESRAHWNGTVSEVLEEEAGIVLNSMFTGDNKFSDLVDADQQIDIVLGVGLFGGFVSGIKTIGYPISRAKAKSGLRKADGVGGWRFADEWDGIRSEIDNAEESELAETVRNLVSTHAKSEEQMRTIVDYARALMKARGVDLAVATATAEGNVTPEQQDAEESFSHGESIAESGEPDAMRDVRTNLDRQRERLVSATSEEFVVEHFDNGNAIDNLRNIDMDDDLRGIALDYINARHVYDGMIQGVRDDIDSRIARSDAEIEGRTHRSTGLIMPATMKVDDRQVYVVSGFLTTFDDGSGIDEAQSDKSIIVRDAETGKLEFTSPSQILNIGESRNAEQEKQAEANRIRQEGAQEASDAIEGRHTFEGGEIFHIIFDNEGHEQMISVLGPSYDEEGMPLPDAVEVQMEDGSTQTIPTATLEGWIADTERMRAERYEAERDAERMESESESGAEAPAQEQISETEETAGTPMEPAAQIQTALERIAKDEQGTPLFESADPETAWDALVEDSEDETEAEEYATGMTKVLEKEAEKARKKVSNVKVTGDRAKYKADKEAARKELAEAEKRLAHWQAMLETKNRRQQEAQAAAEAEERRIAAERAERERLERERQDAEARAEAERLRKEKEERDGIPEMTHDTPENARLRGKRRIGTTVYARQEPITEKVEGKEVTVDFNEKKEGHRPKGRLVVIEAAQGQASHMEGKRNPLFFIDEVQPKDRTDAESILAEQKHAREMDPSLITDSRDMVDPFRGAPTVNIRGEAIQGNHRMAALRYMYANEPEAQKRYRDYLYEHASEFGFTPEQAQAIAFKEEPVLVNMVDVDDAMAIELGQDTGNSRETGGKDRIDADRLAVGIGDKMGRFMDTLLTDDSEDGESLSSLIRRNGLAALKYLRDIGKIDDRQYGTAINKDGSLSDEGVEDVEKFIKRTFFAGESREFGDMFDTLPAKAQSAVLAQIWRDSKTAEADKATPHVKEAVRAFNAMQSIPQFKEARNFKEALQAAEMWRAQTEFNEEGDIVSNQNRHSNFAIRLAAMMKGSSMKETRGILKQMLDWMQDSGEQAGLFDMMDSEEQEEQDRTFRGAVKKVLDMEYQPGETSPVIPTVNDGSAATASAQSERITDEEKDDSGLLDNKGETQEDKTDPSDAQNAKPKAPTPKQTGTRESDTDGAEAPTQEQIREAEESVTDNNDTDNENGENGGTDVAGSDQAGPSGERGGRRNDRGGKRTEKGEGTTESGEGAGTLAKPEPSKQNPKQRELTSADLDAIDPEVSGIDESVIDGARDYIEGERTPWSEMCYNIAKDYVRNTEESSGTDGRTDRAGTQELSGTDTAGSGSGLEGVGPDGGASGGMDREDGGSDVSGSGESGENGARSGGSLSGEEGTGSTEGEISDADDGNTNSGKRGGGRRTGSRGSNVRKPGGKSGSEGNARNDGSGNAETIEGAPRAPHRTENTDGASPEDKPADAEQTDAEPKAPTPKQTETRETGGSGAEAPAQEQIKKTGEEAAQGMIDDALATLEDILKNPGMSRPGQLNDVTTLLAGLGVNAARFLGATAKLGCGLVIKGYYKYAKWRGEMHRNLDPLLMAHTDLTDEQADEFISSAWDMKMSYRGERKKISEWAAELEQEELRRLAQMGLAEKRKLQAQAEGTEVKPCDLDNIRETLPFLLPAQHEDVEKAERQFFKPEHADREHGYGKGYLFTNGTGTGKTYTGLGIAKRFLKQGKGRILIVTVNDTKISDWIKDAKNLGIEATQLPDTKSKGKGVVVTQYANLRQNYALLEDEFDLIIYDESHKLMENQEGIAGSTADMHHMVAAHDAEAVIMRKLETSEPGRNIRESREEIKRLNEILNIINKPDSLVTDKERDLVRNSGYRSEEEVLTALRLIGTREEALNNEMEKAIAEAMADETQRAEAEAISKNTKTVFLSATPFNTPSSLDYAEGYIFSYPEGNEGSSRQQRRNNFLRKNFGKSHRRNSQGNMTRMSEGQITDPEAVEEEEINFSNHLQDELHTMSGRMLDSAYDYSRSFPRFDMPEAKLVNSAMSEIIRGPLSKYFKRTLLDYNYSTAFWEIIKTGFALPRIKEHIALGRKVVVFHRRKASNQDVDRPFASGLREAMSSESDADKAAATEFAIKYGELLNWEANLDYTYPQDRILNEFVTDEEREDYENRMEAWRKKRDAAISAGKRIPPEPKLKSERVGIFNGDQSAGEKQGAVDNFNLADSDQDVIVVQVQSGKEGISLHDTDGKHQRVMMSLALPQSPIEFIQAEGRIYRVGNQSDAIFEYPLLGIDRELFDFAMKINGRSQTSENLAMGAQSRGLRDSITSGALGSTQIPVTDGQGKGGKMLDSRQTQKATGFDHAMSNWKEWQEKEAGLPYDERSIPDPLGFKLMEWSGAERGETVLVGYAGEGSAARYAPSSTKLIALESDSGKLARLAALLGGGGRKILGDAFSSDSSDPADSYSIVNKADIVVVKTKSGTYKDGFSTKKRSVRDIRKALQHTEDSGRIIAIVPTADLKGIGGILNMLEDQRKFEGCVARTVINLPADIFGEESSIIVVDKNQEPSIAEAKAAQGLKIRKAKPGESVEETLSNLRNEEVEKREVDRIAKAVKRVKKVFGAFQNSKLVSTERWRGNNQKVANVTRYGAHVRFTKHIIPESANNLLRCWNGISLDFSKMGQRSYLEEVAKFWAGCRKLSEMGLEEYKNLYERKFRTDAQYQEALDLMGHVCTLIEAATGKTATQLSNIAEGKVENEIKNDMTLSEFKDIYKSLDSGSEELDALAERVFAVASQIKGLTFKMADGNVFSGHNVMAHYAPGKNAIELNSDVFNSIRTSDEQKAQCILHETIHAVTCWALSQYKQASEQERKAMGPIADACKDIEEVFKAINNDSFRADLQAKSKLADNAMYGLSDEYEMLAEMANPAFRRALKAKRLWRQLVNGIKKLFGIDVTDTGEGATTAFDTLNNAINTILDNFDPDSYARYRSNPHHNEGVHEMRNLFDEDHTKKAHQWVQKSLFEARETGAEPEAQTPRQTGNLTGDTGSLGKLPPIDMPSESREAMEAANRAIDEYAERFAEIYGQYQAFMEAKAEIADDLADRMEGELQMIGSMLEGELTRYYLSEGNREEDASRMARDKAGLVRAEITFALNKQAYGESGLRQESRNDNTPEKKPTEGKSKTNDTQKKSYKSAAGEVLEWQSAGGRLRTLKEWEFAVVERQFAEDGMFPFMTGAGKIETDADVAYLFRCLENSAIENAFAVLVKNGRPLIVHFGMGTSNMTIADTTAIRAAMDAYEADKIYFVHNHPSGNLRESLQDRNLYARIAEMAGDKAAGAIIIDVTSGKYSVFDTGNSAESREMPSEAREKEQEHGVLSFSRQAYDKDFDPEGLTQIKGSSDVAQFVSTRRLGEGPKTGYLLLSRSNRITGNFYSTHADLSDPAELANEIAGQCAAHGAEGAILYGNVRLDPTKLARLRGELDKASGKGVRLMDALRIESGLSNGFISALDQGLMEPTEEYGGARSDESGLLFRMREKEPPKKTQKVYKLMRLEGGHLYPLFIDSSAPTEPGVWYDADSPNLDMLRSLPTGTYLMNQETGEAKPRDEWNADPLLMAHTDLTDEQADEFIRSAWDMKMSYRGERRKISEYYITKAS